MYSELKNMTSSVLLFRDEMKVIAGNIDTSDIRRAAKTYQRSLNISELKNRLGLSDLSERGIWLLLAGNGTVRDWFSTHDSFEITTRGVKTMIQRLSHESGIKFSAHAPRGGMAIHNLKQGLSIRVVQALGGWDTITMVERYSKSLTFDDALEFYKQVNASEV